MIDKLLESKQFSGFTGTPEGDRGGEYVQRLEDSFGEYFNVIYARGLNSATAGLHASLIACGVGRDDEVIVTPYSFSSSASCALMVGAKPVFADIEDETFGIDPEQVKTKLTSKTKAVVLVHQFGHPARIHEILNIIRRKGIPLIEDCAQAIGAKVKNQYVGTIGDCGIFSFNQSKTINTGEGGMVITNNPDMDEIIRAVRNHGEVSNPLLEIVGYNYRLCEIEAWLAYEQFIKLDKIIEYRNDLVSQLDLPDWIIKPVVKERHAWWGYPMRVIENRDKLLERLKDNGIACDKYVEPLYNLPIYRQFGYKKGMCPVAERLWDKEMLRLDVGKLTKEKIGVILKIVREV